MRISYWTGWLDPLMVAVSKEVFQLLPHFQGSYAFGISGHYAVQLSPRSRAVGMNVRLYPLLRAVAPLIERRFDVSHVYTHLGDWHFLRMLGRRPIVLTATQRTDQEDYRLLERVNRVVAQTEPLAAAARRAGVPDRRVSIIYPGVDLDMFRDTAPPELPWKCLFASSPESPEELHSKGVDLMLDLAAREPELEVTLLWRPFGAMSDAALEEVRARNLPNVRIIHARIPHIEQLFQSVHFAVAPFRSGGKPCPNSILESLASGRPVLASSGLDIAPMIAEENAGVVFEPSGTSIAEAFHRLREDYPLLRRNARRLAERRFDIQETVRAYRRTYASLVGAK